MALDLTFSNEVSIGEVISSLSFLVAAIALFMNWQQQRKNNRTNRSVFLKDLYSLFFSDPELFGAWQKIEHPDLLFERDFYGTDVEKAADRLLGHCEMIATVHDCDLISRAEMKRLDFVLQRVFGNKNIQRHFLTIDKWSAEQKIPKGEGPFSSFRTYCELNFAEQRLRIEPRRQSE